MSTYDIDNRRSLYPNIQPRASGWMSTSDGHEIYYEECGTPEGKVCVVLHGGPGGSLNPTLRRFFNPDKWRIILFDQRGCGHSRPHGSLDNNTTWHLIKDIEQLRNQLDVKTWSVFGGSWGSSLALAYALTHPQSVESLILRGIFLLTQREIHWFYQEGTSYLFPDAWESFLAPIPVQERGNLLQAYHTRLTHPDPEIRYKAAKAWSHWEGDTLSLRGPEARPPKFEDESFVTALARIECHYFQNHGFFPKDGWLLEQAPQLRSIPTWIVQGRFDVITPMESAWALKKALPDAKFYPIWDAGHASTEPGIIDALVRATDLAADIY